MLLNKYNIYFNHFRDYTVAVAFLAMCGLKTNIEMWERTFVPAFRDPNSTDVEQKELFTGLAEKMSLVILLSTLVCIYANYLKTLSRQIWKEYKDPMAFYKNMVQLQVRLGVMSSEDLSENFETASFGFWSVITDSQFLFETIILLLIPFPTAVFPNGLLP